MIKSVRYIVLGVVFVTLLIVLLTAKTSTFGSSQKFQKEASQGSNATTAVTDTPDDTPSFIPKENESKGKIQFENLQKVDSPVAPNDALTSHNANGSETKTKKRMAIITFFSSDEWSQSLKRLTFGNFQEYAGRHGYDAIDALENPFLQGLFKDHMKKFHVTHYFKFHVMAYYLPFYDWILWADGDSIFLNQGLRMEDIVDDNYDALFSINTKEEPSWSLIINAGHYFLRNSPWTHTFLKECIYMSEHNCHEFLYLTPDGKEPVLNQWIHLCGEDGGYWLSDQGILQWLIMYKGQDYRCHMKFVGFREFNSEFPWYEEGDFIVHFPGRSLEERQKLVPLFLKNVNPMNGLLDHTKDDLSSIAPVSNPSNGKGMYSKFYAPLNMPCTLYKAIVKPKLIPGKQTIMESNIGPIPIEAVPAAFQLPEGAATHSGPI